MKSVFVIDDNGRGMEEIRAFLRDRGYAVIESGVERPEALRFTQFAFDRASVQIFWHSRDGTIIYANDSACHALGYTRQELVGMSFRNIDPYALSVNDIRVSERWNALRERGHDRIETYHRARNGRVYPVEIIANYLEFEGKEFVCCFVTDVSERKRIEEKLLLQQYCIERANTIFLQLSADGKILMANECACNSLGYTKEEILALRDSDISPLTNDGSRADLHTLDTDGSLTGETDLQRKDGSVFPVEFSINKMEFNGKTYIFGFAHDITERIKTEQALRISQYIVDNASIGIYRGREDGRILYANRHSARMLGYTREELCSMTFLDIVPALDAESWREYRRSLRAEGFKKLEAVHRRKDGTTLPVEVTVNYLEFGEEPFSCSFAQDITERKKTENALRESEEKFRLLIEISPNAIVLIQEERIVYVNPAATGIYGFTKEELIGAEFWRFVHEECRDIARKRGLGRLGSEPLSKSFAYKIVTKYGDQRWVMASSVLMEYEGKPALIVTLVDITEAKRTEEALRESEARLRLAMDMSGLVQWEYDAETGMFRFDDHFYSLYGTSAEQEGGYLMSLETYVRKFVHPDDIPDVKSFSERAVTNAVMSPTGQIEHRIIRADGQERYVSVRTEVARDQEGRVVKTRGANQDITERKRAEEDKKNLEAQLHQAQKMEAIGQLAGGVAHDFNNILTAIVGFAEVIAMRLDHDNPLRRHVSQIMAAADRAADLTNGLLAFSRKQILHKRAIDVQETIHGIRKMLRRLIPEDIDFRIRSAEPGMTVMADRGRIEQVLMNLVTNARDAMPSGGTLTIDAEPMFIDREECRVHGVENPGTYARITVRDTGCGMDEETRERIFEPFFTTKTVGKGTGLGLSIIYGIITQHHGFVTVSSSPGHGTSFSLFLPLVDLAVQEQPCARPHGAAPGGNETVLLAEDDDMIRELNRTLLEEAGYSVIDAVDGRDALEKLEQYPRCVDVLVTDVIMPHVDGKTLYEEIMKIRPEMKVLFMSGYSTDMLDSRGVADDGVNFIEKPVMPSEFLRKLREILDGP